MKLQHVCAYIEPPRPFALEVELSDLGTQIYSPRPAEEMAALGAAREAAVEHEASVCRQVSRDHATSMGDATRTAVYRLSDAAGRLLYVGQSARFLQRWESHSRTKNWWPEVADFSLEWCDSRTEALAVEAHAIRSEQPVHNVVHKPRARKTKTQLERLLPHESDGRWVHVTTGVRRPAHWIDAQ